MKTIEDKAKRYDEALERAKEKYPTCYAPALLEYIFPELTESEDEKIRKQILSFLKEFEYEHYRNLDFSAWIVWLENQGEHHIACNEEQLKVLNEVLNFAANHESPYWNDYIFGILNSLIKQLKKLKV